MSPPVAAAGRRAAPPPRRAKPPAAPGGRRPAKPSSPPSSKPTSSSKPAAKRGPSKAAARPPPARAPVDNNAAAGATVDVDKEAHKLFDEVVITVRSGRGGRGEITRPGAGRVVPNFKFKKDGRSTKNIFLAASAPARGADGGAVLLRADPGVTDLLHLHARAAYAAKDGADGDASRGTNAPRTGAARALALSGPARAPPLVLPVPLGTVVKRVKGGALVAELLTPGQTVCVAHGGVGGAGVVAPARRRKGPAAAADDDDDAVVDDDNWRADADGGPGEAAALRLTLRVVADVGLVGLPNAGKSSLLAALTRARPEIAAYPFTTLMPNLGVMAAGAGEGGDTEFEGDPAAPPRPTLADLPGLIEGAHVGRGLGRMFLRHLRRSRVVLHVVDGSTADPAADYATVRRELALYNPEYVERPHVVALNKADLTEGGEAGDAAADGAPTAADRFAAAIAAAGDATDGDATDATTIAPPPPTAVVVTSAATGAGVADLAAALTAALEAAGGGPAPPPKPAAAARDRAARVARARMERNRGGFEPDLDW